jgi:hypothetical protein
MAAHGQAGRRTVLQAASIPASLLALAAPQAIAQNGQNVSAANPQPSQRSAELVGDDRFIAEGRRGFGLSYDLDSIRAVQARPDVVLYMNLPLTPDEHARVRFQMDVQTALARAEAAITQAAGESLTGYWIDHAIGGVVTIGAVDQVDVGQFSSLFPEGTVLRFERTRYTYSELDAVRNNIEYAVVNDGRTIDGVHVAAINLNAKLGVVEVLIDHEAPDIDEALRSAYPDRPIVARRVDASSYDARSVNRTDYPPLMGGYFMDFSGHFCTAGFGARIPGTNLRGVVTAGHCAANGAPAWIAGTSNFIGNVGNREFSNAPGADTDSEFVGFDSNTQGWVYVNDIAAGTKQYRGVHGIWSNGAPAGAFVHMSAGKRDKTWGNWLGNGDYTQFLGGDNGDYRIEHAQNAHLCAQTGDSGSPVYTLDNNQGLYGTGAATAVGVVSATSEDTPECPENEIVIWSRIDRVMNSLGVELLPG